MQRMLHQSWISCNDSLKAETPWLRYHLLLPETFSLLESWKERNLFGRLRIQPGTTTKRVCAAGIPFFR